MRRLALGLSIVGAVVVGLLLLRPVLLGPVTGDDVYYSLNAASDAHDTVLSDLGGLPTEFRHRFHDGRVNVLTAFERRLSGRAMVETAVATGRPVNQVLAVFRLGYAALALFAVHALLRALRWRRPGTGTLVQLSRATRTVLMVAGGLAVAVGAQPQLVGLHGLNGWLAYPVSTWTAAFSIFGVVALTLWLARLTAQRGRAVAVVAALVLAAVGVLSNYRYELTFPALPLTLLALLVVPVSDLEHRAAGRRAKWLLGSAYVAGFVPLLLANRILLRQVCERGGCYEGVTLSLGPGALRTFVVNVLSTIPGTGTGGVRELLRSQSLPTDGLWHPTVWSVLVGLALVATLALAWVGTGLRTGGGATDAAGARAEATLCLVGAVLLLAGALGAAGVMSLSERAQLSMSLGTLYRHSVVTWTGLAFAAVALVLAWGRWRPRAATPAFLALALAMGVLVALKMPTDGRIMAANADRMSSTSAVFRAVVSGDEGPGADRHRCHVLRDVDREMTEFYSRNVRRSADRSFHRFWGAAFCSRH